MQEEYNKMKEAFDKDGNLIEGKEFDPNNEISSEEKLEFAKKMLSHNDEVRKEEESLLDKINKHAEDSRELSRGQKRQKLIRLIEGYKRHVRSKPVVNINDNDQESFDKTIKLKSWVVQKNSFENLILKYGNQKKLNDVKKLLKSSS
jgi:hypothetical protein